VWNIPYAGNNNIILFQRYILKVLLNYIEFALMSIQGVGKIFRNYIVQKSACSEQDIALAA